jgi:membrane protein
MGKNSFTRLIQIFSGGFPGGESFSRLERFAHFWVQVWGSFVRNRGPVRASALSYSTLLALIPMLAVAMSVSSVFLKSKGEEQVKVFVRQVVEHLVPAAPAETNSLLADLEFPDTQDTRLTAAQDRAADYIHGFIQNTYSGTLGVTGMIFLLLTAILMLTRIEETFNDIWGVTRGRTWFARIVLYWSTITLLPLLLIAGIGLASGAHVQQTRELVGGVAWLDSLLAQLIPIALISVTFALFYKLMPATKVQFRAALVGGALAGTAWHIYNLLGFVLASRAVAASKIYGSLALVPLLMGGLYVVWLTVLFGAQVAYAWMTAIARRFQRHEPPATLAELSAELAIPSKLAQQVLSPLLAAHLVSEVANTDHAFVPARPLDTITAHDILHALRATHGHEVVTREEPLREELLGEFARIQLAEKTAAAQITLLALAQRQPVKQVTSGA